jgi:TRAP-type C4-dicarboxylate transport system substrate-binding protein
MKISKLSSTIGLLGLLFISGLLLVAVQTGSAAESTPAAKPVEILLNGGTDAPMGFEGQEYQWFGSEVTKRTNGRVTFKYAWSGSMTKGGQELDSVKSGLSGIVNVPVALYADKLPFTNFSNGIPFSMEGAEKKYPIFRKLFDEFPQFNAEWAAQGARPLAIVSVPDVDLQSTVPIRSVEDLKGKKIALIGRYAPKWLAATGAVPISTIMPDRTAQLQTGMLQGSIISMSLAANFGYEEYAKYYIQIDLGTWIGSLLVMNNDLYKSLPKDIQTVFDQVAGELSVRLAKHADKIVQDYQAKMKSKGVTFMVFPAEEKAKWAKMMNDPVDLWVKDMSAKGLPAKELVAKYVALQKAAGYSFPKGLSPLTD